MGVADDDKNLLIDYCKYLNNELNTKYKVPTLQSFVNLPSLTEVAGEGGPDLAPQKFLSSQKFRHLMG